MSEPERFIYHGNATVLTGHVHRPADVWIDVGGASALPANGGVSRNTTGKSDFGGVIGFDSADTHAQGAIHEPKAARRAKAPPDPASEAHTGAEVRGLRVGGRVRLTAKRVRAELTALCACHDAQPSIGAMDDALFEGVAFGRYQLTVAINRAFFREHDTHAKLCAACADPARAAGPRAVLAPGVDAAQPPSSLLTTIVKSIRWKDKPYPRATIDRHVVTVPGFGRVFFGEMLVTGPTRRLTMLRFALDAEVVLDGACCEVEAGGIWYR